MNRKEFPRVTPEAVGLHSEAIERLVDQLESGFTEMHGLMIMRHGKVCTEGWWAPYGPGLRHGLQSLTKTYAATAVGIAYTEGLLRLEDRLVDLFPDEAPENPSDNLKQLTVRDVLCMGCGMDTMPSPTKDWVRDFLATPVCHTPGSTFMYNTVGSSMLGAIVKKVSGQGLQDYLRPRLFDKIGIDADNLRWLYLPDGMELGGGGLYATTEDNLRLMKLYADGGVWEGERILAADYVAKAISIQNDSASESKGNPEAFDNFLGYGFQIWQCKPAGVYRADGAMGQFSIVVPSMDMILSINETATGAHWAQKTLDTVWEFLGSLSPSDAPLPESPAAARLAARVKHLALAAPAFAPRSPLAARLNGRTFAVREGRFAFEVGDLGVSGNALFAPRYERFRLDFASDTCRFYAIQNGAPITLTIALDGTRRHNTLPLTGVPYTQVYLNGYWSETSFIIHARWIETCFEQCVAITPEEGRVTICQKMVVGGFDAMPRDSLPALASPCTEEEGEINL